MLASMAKLKAAACCAWSLTAACNTGAVPAISGIADRRSFRDSRLASIGGGADEVMLQIISKLMGTLPRLENR